MLIPTTTSVDTEIPVYLVGLSDLQKSAPVRAGQVEPRRHRPQPGQGLLRRRLHQEQEAEAARRHRLLRVLKGTDGSGTCPAGLLKLLRA